MFSVPPSKRVRVQHYRVTTRRVRPSPGLPGPSACPLPPAPWSWNIEKLAVTMMSIPADLPERFIILNICQSVTL